MFGGRTLKKIEKNQKDFFLFFIVFPPHHFGEGLRHPSPPSENRENPFLDWPSRALSKKGFSSDLSIG